jgi:hypothetical protein
MNHPEFVNYLSTHKLPTKFPPCESNGCRAHIPCDWLTLENFEAAAKRHKKWLEEQQVNIATILKPATQSEGWCVLWAREGSANAAGTYLLPKYWLGSSVISDKNAPTILARKFKLAFEFFRFLKSENIKLSCRSTYPSPYERLDLLRIYLGLVGTQMAPAAENVSASPVIVASAAQGLPQFDVADYERMGEWLLGVLQNPDQNFKDFVLLAPGFL